MLNATPFLKEALEAAQQYRGFCAPNPAVGAVVVKNGQVLAVGAHQGCGKAHAEVVALDQLSAEQTLGATLYVTLEPCCHYGRTPPCVQRIIAAGISEVIFAYLDPNPIVAGRGQQALRDAGILCEHVVLEAINDFYQSYRYWHQFKKPFVTAKLAMSADSKIAGPNGQPVAITGEECARFTHQQRWHSDAILTTAKTILSDDPQLNARHQQQVASKPIYVLDSQLRTPLEARIFSTATRVTIFYDKNYFPSESLATLQAQGARCVGVTRDEQGLVWEEVLQYVGSEGVHDLWVEAGAQCFQSLMQQGLAQQAYLYRAPQKGRDMEVKNGRDMEAPGLPQNWQAPAEYSATQFQLGEDAVTKLVKHV